MMATDPMDTPKLSFPVGLDPKVGLDLSVQVKWNIPDAMVVKAAVAGGTIKRAKYPNQPYTPDEIRAESMKCIDAGACCVHLHTRSDEGGNIADLDENIRRFKLIIDPIKEKYGDEVVIDCNFATQPTMKEDLALLKTGLAELVPVNMFFRQQGVSAEVVQSLVKMMQDNGVKPEIAIHCDGDIDRAKRALIDTGVYKKPFVWDLVLSYGLGTTPMYNEMAMAESLIWQVRQIRYIDPDSVIMVAGCGRPSSYLVTMAMLLGLHVKVGTEDTYFKWPHKDDIIDNNAELVADTISIANYLGRRAATANEYRAFVGLPQR